MRELCSFGRHAVVGSLAGPCVAESESARGSVYVLFYIQYPQWAKMSSREDKLDRGEHLACLSGRSQQVSKVSEFDTRQVADVRSLTHGKLRVSEFDTRQVANVRSLTHGKLRVPEV